MTEIKRLDVPLPGQGYPIFIGDGLLAEAGSFLTRELGLVPPQKIFVIADGGAAEHWLPTLAEALQKAGFDLPPGFILPPGEATKTLVHYMAVMDHLLTHGAKRDSVVLALGGGVIGDLAGFAAATALRGIRLVQVPTTLLSQVDSSVGGKTGVNTDHGKNLVGSFHQPSLVLIDTATLDTLPAREVLAGYAEVVKYGLLGDAAFFDWLEQNGADVLSGRGDARADAILQSCAAKATIVLEDPLEKTGRRALLNLGHTFGHALESLGQYDGRLLHGEAVSIGMLWAMRYSARRGLCTVADVDRVEAHLKTSGLMLKPPFPVAASEVLQKMMGDKKNDGDRLTLVLCRAIGHAEIVKDVDSADVLQFLQDVISGE